jgi:membrane-bound lytic murein transglycosylase D
MPLIESDFDASAYSHKHASGLWQLTPAIAKYFKVQISSWYDGRQDVIDSTRAALDFMEYLHKRFDGDWYHAIAAYNLGEGSVLRAISNNKKQGKPTDFFNLKLPKQTSQYVPKLLAAAQLLKSQKMAFPTISNSPTIAVLPIDDAVILDNQKQWQQLEFLNHGVIRFPAIIDAPHIVVPVAEQTQFKDMLANLDSNDYSKWQHYTVKRGDSLSVIAKRYKVGISQLKVFNDLKSNTIRIGQKLVLPQLADTQIEHQVKSGDSLWKISSHYKVSITKLKQWNNLSSDHLKIGKKLTVFLSNR